MCCAPCAVYVIEKWRETYDVTLFFYNPNIHPEPEYLFRKKELEKISLKKGWQTVYPGHEMEEWFNRVKKHKGYEKEPERGKRCSLCFNIRLRKTFVYARDQGCEVVASTLSISPYKVTRQINEEGVELAEEFDIEFLAENFKKQDGYNIGRKMALSLGIKHQDYCGCVYSREERNKKTRLKEKF